MDRKDGAGAARRFFMTAHALVRGLVFLLSTSAIALAGDVYTFPTKGVDLNVYRTFGFCRPR